MHGWILGLAGRHVKPRDNLESAIYNLKLTCSLSLHFSVPRDVGCANYGPGTKKAPSAPAVDFAAVADDVNQQYLVTIKQLVDDPIVTDPQLVQTGEVAAQGLRSDCAEIRRQPVDALNDPTRFRPIQPRQVAGRGIQEASPERHA